MHRKKTAAESLIEEHFRASKGGGGGGGAAVGSESDASSQDAASDSDSDAGAPQRKRRMLAAREDASADLFSRNKSAAALRQRPLEERAAEAADARQVRRSGNRDLTFVPRHRCGADHDVLTASRAVRFQKAGSPMHLQQC